MRNSCRIGRGAPDRGRNEPSVRAVGRRTTPFIPATAVCGKKAALHVPAPVAGAGTPYTQNGFTLIEILVVVVIIGILGAVIVPNLLSRPDQARVTAAQQDLRALGSALDLYRLDNFQYPSTDQGLEALVRQPSGFPEPKNWNPDGYIKALPTDPWGSPYMYERDGAEVSLFSLGADGTEGGEGVAADIHLDEF